MKKGLLTIVGAFLMTMGIGSCGNKNVTEQETSGENIEATESVAGAEDGTETSRAAISAAKELYNYIVEINEKDKSGKLSDKQKMEALETILTRDQEWDKNYKHLKEGDYSPTQWKELQEMKAKIKELLNVSVR